MTEIAKLEEEIAKATRAKDIAHALVREFREKTRLAEDELSEASGRLDELRYELDNAIKEAHNVIYGEPIDDTDRAAFEKCWTDRRAEIAKVRAERTRLNEEAQRKADQKAKEDLIIEVDGQIVHPDVIRTNLGF